MIIYTITYTTREAAEKLGCYWRTVSNYCKDLLDNRHIQKKGNTYLIDSVGIEMLKKEIQPIGRPKGKCRAKQDKNTKNKK